MRKNIHEFLTKYLSDLTNSIKKSDISAIDRASAEILNTVKKKSTIYLCGNGLSVLISKKKKKNK